MKSKSTNKKKLIPIILAVIIIAVGIGANVLTQKTKTSTKTQAVSALKTAQVTRGDLILSASGTGSVVAGQTANLSFKTSGVVAVLNVQPGDKVKKGQALAELDDLESLQGAVSLANSNLATAKNALDVFQDAADANLGNAQLILATAQKTLTDAKTKYKTDSMVRCSDDETQAYYDTYFRLKKNLEDLGDGGGNTEYFLKILVPAQNEVTKAYNTYLYCAKYTSYEIDASNANIALGEAALITAQATLNTLKANNGLDPVGLAQAQNTLDNAQMAFDKAKQNLEGAVIKSPFDGTVMSVVGQVGESAGTATFITVSDLDHPLVEFFVDETDIANVALDYKVEVTFDAIPKKTFTGTVVRVYPTLETVSNYLALKALAQVDLTSENLAYSFSSGMNASVEVISGSSLNTLLVPLEAIRDLGDDQFGVFVMDDNNQPKMKVVQVGLMDVTKAEIKSGLEMGDVVTTGITETK